jgi:hypothetical protein
LNFSKKDSDVIAKMKGNFDEEAKARREKRNELERSNTYICFLHFLNREQTVKVKKEVDRQVLKVKIRYRGNDNVKKSF